MGSDARLEAALDDDAAVDVFRSAAAGSTAALHAFRDAYYEDLVRYAYGHKLEDPEVAASSALLGLIEHADVFRGRTEGEIRAYMYRSIRNRASGERRRDSGRGAVLSLDEIDAEARALDRLMIEDDVDGVVDRLTVDDLLSQLNESQREVIELRYLDDLTLKEAAERTGRSIQATAQLQKRAIHALRAAILAVIVVLAVMRALAAEAEPPAPDVTDTPDRSVVEPDSDEPPVVQTEDAELGAPSPLDGLEVVTDGGETTFVMDGAEPQTTSAATLSGLLPMTGDEPPVLDEVSGETCALEGGALPAATKIHYVCNVDGTPLRPQALMMLWIATVESDTPAQREEIAIMAQTAFADPEIGKLVISDLFRTFGEVDLSMLGTDGLLGSESEAQTGGVVD